MSSLNSSLKNKTFRRLDLSAVTRALVIREYYAVKGDVHEFVITRDMEFDEMSHIVAYVEGAVEISRSASPDVIHRVERAGNTSNDGAWKVGHRGKVIHRVTSDTYRYYCITDHLFRKMRSKTIRFDELQSQQVSPGVLVFVAMGSIEVNDKRLDAPAIFDVPVDGEVTVVHGRPGTLALEIERMS